MKQSLWYAMSLMAFLMLPILLGIMLGISWAFDIEMGRLSGMSIAGIIGIVVAYTWVLSRDPKEPDAC